ncbi:MAG: alpha/beta hydrolase, partial [Bacteroidota bacterium]
EITLVGHSMGGQIAMHVVLDEVAAVEKLVLLAPAGFEVFTDQEKAWFKAVLTPAVVKATPEAQIIKNFEINFFEMPEDARFMIADRLAMRAIADYDAYCEMIPKCVNGMLEQPVFEQLPSISVPTLVMYGEADALIPNRILHPTLTPVAVAEKGQALIPNSKLVMVPKAGHFVQWDGASVVNEAIKKFIE